MITEISPQMTSSNVPRLTCIAPYKGKGSFLARLIVVSLLFLPLVGCGVRTTPVQAGIGGGLLGAGIGAAVGSIIERGNVGQSAGLGLAIGIPVGVALNALTDELRERRQEAQIQVVRDRQQAIYEKDREIAQLRKEVDAEAPAVEIAYPPRRYFTGATLGNAFR